MKVFLWYLGQQKVVPYRESRLTRLFQTILQGDGKASMIVNVSQNPSLFDETIHVLEFSAVASEVSYILHMKVNLVVKL